MPPCLLPARCLPPAAGAVWPSASSRRLLCCAVPRGGGGGVERLQQLRDGVTADALLWKRPSRTPLANPAGLPTTREVEKAEALGRDVYEYVKQVRGRLC